MIPGATKGRGAPGREKTVFCAAPLRRPGGRLGRLLTRKGFLLQGEGGGQVPAAKTRWTHVFAWSNNPKRAQLQGRRCRIVAAGKMGSCLVEFEGGGREIISFRALKKIHA